MTKDKKKICFKIVKYDGQNRYIKKMWSNHIKMYKYDNNWEFTFENAKLPNLNVGVEYGGKFFGSCEGIASCLRIILLDELLKIDPIKMLFKRKKVIYIFYIFIF